MSRDTCAYINVGALRHNLSRVRHFAPNQKIWAVIKADGYGHGLLNVASALNDAEGFGVAHLDEAMELRDSGILHPLLILEGAWDSQELTKAVRRRFQLVVHQWEQIEMLENTQLSDPVMIWLKIDTGMNRLGIAMDDFNKAYQRLQNCKQVRCVNLMTHFSCADNLDNPSTLKQIESFNDTVGDLPGCRSMANSAGILGWTDSLADWVRPGIALFGGCPIQGKMPSDFGLKPVMTLQSKLIAIQNVKVGESVGYGAKWTAQEPTRVGVVAIGYGDGYPRHAVDGTPVLIRGYLAPIVGLDSMDMITINLNNVEHAKTGDPVTLWGDGLAAEIVAEKCDTISYELFCKITSRVKKEIVHS
ncbi:MAG: alanine racemase [Pseudomonadales bacterium]|nr:alanine racemase [Pseudomonadales bacterium]